MGQSGPTVFVVVPVFERLEHTLGCIRDLRAQTFPFIEIVIVDGGSVDGSVAVLRSTEGITLIADVGEQWWSGATWFGIEHALHHGADDDYVMLLNNDTRFGPEMVAVLVEESHPGKAAVAPVAVAPDGTIVNSGVWIDWKRYDITQRMGRSGAPDSTWTVDALEGRGTLVPFGAVRRSGNVAKDRLPHHAADYELSMRLARSGTPLAMTNRTTITVEWDYDALRLYEDRATLRRLAWELTDRRSHVNLHTHFALIDLAGPARRRRRLKARFLLRRLWWGANRSNIPVVAQVFAAVRFVTRLPHRLMRMTRRRVWEMRH